MKKGLLSILASSLLVVGCQNYDDQFTLLENQITALTQTVDGLSQVQSDSFYSIGYS
jgi:nitrous oxide reductase accessory protein NosL